LGIGYQAVQGGRIGVNLLTCKPFRMWVVESLTRNPIRGFHSIGESRGRIVYLGHCDACRRYAGSLESKETVRLTLAGSNPERRSVQIPRRFPGIGLQLGIKEELSLIDCFSRLRRGDTLVVSGPAWGSGPTIGGAWATSWQAADGPC
jgi:hypothetical protein